VEIVALTLAALLSVACVVFVARPFLREPSARDDRLGAPGASAERLQLVEARDRALAALKELEFDHRTGKVSDADYRELVQPLRREAAAALAALERLQTEERPRADGAVEVSQAETARPAKVRTNA
jgi:hypothetical protein